MGLGVFIVERWASDQVFASRPIIAMDLHYLMGNLGPLNFFGPIHFLGTLIINFFMKIIFEQKGINFLRNFLRIILKFNLS